MKRLLALLLILALLTGCGIVQPTEPTQGTEEPTTVPTEPPAPSLYESDSPVEQQTDGAVRAYPLDAYCDGMLVLEDRVVLYYRDEQMQLKAYSGDELRLDASAAHHIQIPANGTGVQVQGQGLSYYDPGTNTLVILDADLREKHSAELPSQIQGIPVVNAVMDTVYYCTNEGIRAMDLDTGIAHMLRQQENYSGMAFAQCFDGSLLVCTVTNSDGSTSTEFVSTETGLQAGKDAGIEWVESYEELYFLKRTDSSREKYLLGTRDGDVREFQMPENAYAVLSAVEMGGVLTVTDEEKGHTLDFYALDSGLRTASVTIEGFEYLRNVVADPRGYVWFMDENTLYRWEVDKSPVSDETVYTSPYYTGDAPNEGGLTQCQEDADALGEKYGLEIRIWQDAVTAPWENMILEFRVEVYETALTEVDAVLRLFPEGMLEELGSICDSEMVTVSIVADTGTEQGQQTWEDGDAHIAVEAGENLRVELLRTLYRVMDTYVLGETSMLDEWDADKPAEDRARFFVEALSEDNGSFFESYSNQSKLRTLCRAIRRAFDLRDYEAELPWEQYLDDPLY